uniref:7TM_GPCR_Srx domain-containing protein n=3 Tax=Caenorhabditis tropicalis TaxID=1561998 RepID=A0A1I7UVH4_9PELO
MESVTIVTSILGFVSFDEQLFNSLYSVQISFLGVIFNWTVVIANRQITTSKHSFGILTANQAFGDAIYSTTFLFYVSPMIYLNSEFLLKYSEYAGYWLLVCYDLSTQSHFLISCNRFCAVYYPVKYSTIFSINNTYFMSFLVNFFSVALTFVNYYIGCPLAWYPEVFLFNFPPTTFCSDIAFYTDFCKYFSFISLVVVIDIMTVLKVHHMRKRIQQTTVSSDKKVAAQRAREMSFLTQTCIQGVIFTCELILYFILSPMIENRWILFFCTSVAWVTVHSLDGFVTLMFNQDMKKFVKNNLLRKGKEEEASRTGNTDLAANVSNICKTI